MPRLASSPAGVTLLELVAVLAIVAIVAAGALPRFGRLIDTIRVRGALDLVVAELYRARMTAVEQGRPVRLVLVSNPTGCVDRVRLEIDGPAGARSTTTALDVGPVCLRHNGNSTLVYDGRGMLRPPGRSIFSATGVAEDSVVLSIAGRIRRSY